MSKQVRFGLFSLIAAGAFFVGCSTVGARDVSAPQGGQSYCTTRSAGVYPDYYSPTYLAECPPAVKEGSAASASR